MHTWTAWQLGMPLTGLLWLIILSLRVRMLSRRVAAREAQARPPDQSPQRKVTVAELLDRHDQARHQPTARGPASPEMTESHTNADGTTMPGPAVVATCEHEARR